MPAEWIDSSVLRWIPALPLAAAALLALSAGVLRQDLGRAVVTFVAVTASAGSLLASGFAFAVLVRQAGTEVLHDTVYDWFGVGVLDSVASADVALRFDALSATFCILFTSLAVLAQIHEHGRGTAAQRDHQRFSADLARYLGSVLLLTLADNLVLFFAGAQGVVLTSSLFATFDLEDGTTARASTRMHGVTRLGDLAFLAGTFLLYWGLSDAGAASFTWRGIEEGFPKLSAQLLDLPSELQPEGGAPWTLPTLIALCFGFSACVYSAQVPFHFWVARVSSASPPSAALVHTAGLLGVGLFLCLRLSFVFAAAPGVSLLLAWVGGVTALLASAFSIAQRDFGRVLAYVAAAQLGLAYCAVGSGAYAIAVFHFTVTSISVFLAYLALGAVVEALQGERDLTRMGGVGEKLWRTRWVTLVGVWSLAALPPFSSFFSTLEVLAAVDGSALAGRGAILALGVAGSGCIAFSLARMFVLCFQGRTRVDLDFRARLEDPDPSTMRPLYILAGFGAVAGALTLPQFWGDTIGLDGTDSLSTFLAPTLTPQGAEPPVSARQGTVLLWMLLATAIGGSGSAWLYLKRLGWTERASRGLGPFRDALANGLYVDTLWEDYVVQPTLDISRDLLDRGVDRGLIDEGLVDGGGRVLRGVVAHGLRYAHSGHVHTYLVAAAVGVALILFTLVR